MFKRSSNNCQLHKEKLYQSLEIKGKKTVAFKISSICNRLKKNGKEYVSNIKTYNSLLKSHIKIGICFARGCF